MTKFKVDLWILFFELCVWDDHTLYLPLEATQDQITTVLNKLGGTWNKERHGIDLKNDPQPDIDKHFYNNLKR